MKLNWTDRNQILELAFDYAHAKYKFSVGCALSLENSTHDYFRVEVHDGCHTHAKVLVNETFYSVKAAIKFFSPQIVQLPLFEATP
jgi:hypothetical protein